MSVGMSHPCLSRSCARTQTHNLSLSVSLSLSRARSRPPAHQVSHGHFEHVTTFKRNPHTLLDSESSLLLPAYNDPPAARLQVSLSLFLPPSFTFSISLPLSLLDIFAHP